MDAGRYGVDTGGEPEEVDALGLLADGGLGVDTGDVLLAAGEGLLDFVALSLLVFTGAGGLSVELFGGELGGLVGRPGRRGL